mmetsp:Transcript_16019/g.24009  ORF Transcript_16019/g.24009 Transcript_16019/m.24009 type:complete len:95 (+) Transcript_16019:498-782(+)
MRKNGFRFGAIYPIENVKKSMAKLEQAICLQTSVYVTPLAIYDVKLRRDCYRLEDYGEGPAEDVEGIIFCAKKSDDQGRHDNKRSFEHISRWIH